MERTPGGAAPLGQHVQRDRPATTVSSTSRWWGVSTSATAARMAAVPDRARQAFRILHVGFVVAPVLAGLDKFSDVALRDFGLSLGALALARLAEAFPASGAVLRPAAADRQRQ